MEARTSFPKKNNVNVKTENQEKMTFPDRISLTLVVLILVIL